MTKGLLYLMGGSAAHPLDAEQRDAEGLPGQLGSFSVDGGSVLALYPLHIECPTCCSSEITYTCEPKCCFNHICAACYTTFELFTEVLEQTPQTSLLPPQEARDCLAPTVACARCDSVEVYMIEAAGVPQGALICLECHSLLRCGVSNIETR